MKKSIFMNKAIDKVVFSNNKILLTGFLYGTVEKKKKTGLKLDQ